MLGAYLTYGKQNKDKINTKLHVFNIKKFGHGKTIQAPIVGDFCSTSDVYYSIIRVIIIKLENAILAEFLE